MIHNIVSKNNFQRVLLNSSLCLQPSVHPPVQSTATPNQPTPQLVCDEDPPLDRVLQVPSTDPSITVQLATVQPLSEGGTESTADNVLQMLSQGRLPNIASEIEGVEEEEEGGKGYQTNSIRC